MSASDDAKPIVIIGGGLTGGKAFDRGLEISGDRIGDREPENSGRVHTSATTRNSLMMLLRGNLAASILVPAPMPSGRLETKIATNKATLTGCPPARPIPRTACSGTPSRNEPSARLVPGKPHADHQGRGREGAPTQRSPQLRPPRMLRALPPLA